MRSMLGILNLVQDGQITTKEQAAALVAEEVAEMVERYNVSAEEAKKTLLSNIGYVTKYLSHKQADNVMDLFETEHPAYGRQHPSAEEAYRLGHEYAERRMKENLEDKARKS